MINKHFFFHIYFFTYNPKSNLGMIWVDGNVVPGPTKDVDSGGCPA